MTETCGGCVCQSLCDRDMWWLSFDSLCVTETCGGCVCQSLCDRDMWWLF